MAVVAALGALGAAPAVAHQSPANCSTNGLDLTVSKSQTLVRNGDQMTYTVAISNNKPGSCDLTGLGVTLTLPAADGTPTGQSVTLASNINLLAGSAETVIGTVPYTVALNSGLSNAVVKAESSGVLHDAPTDNLARIEKTLGTTVTQPHLTLTETVTPTSGESPTTATFTYTVTNDSSTPAPIANPVVTDDRCANPVYTGGDANGNGVLDVGESWTFACTTTITTPGTITSTSTVTGTNTVDNRPVGSAPASATVTVSAPRSPSAPEQPGQEEPGLPSITDVLGQDLASPNSPQARRPSRCLSTPQRLRVRAGERTRIRVRVREDGEAVERTLVRIIGPGYNKRKVTNANGVAVFRVKPKRSGTLIIQTSSCGGADRIRVLRARQVTNDQVPRGTG
jgi:uncharacterized repeat protein (TIGR01451 family)